MSTHIYEALANSSYIWEYVVCGLPNFSSSLFDSSMIRATNYFWPINLDLPDKRHSESIFTNQPQYSLTPSRENIRTSNRPHNAKKGVTHTAQKATKRKLCLLNINCQSMVNIKDQPHVMLDNMRARHCWWNRILITTGH